MVKGTLKQTKACPKQSVPRRTNTRGYRAAQADDKGPSTFSMEYLHTFSHFISKRPYRIYTIDISAFYALEVSDKPTESAHT